MVFHPLSIDTAFKSMQKITNILEPTKC